MIDLPLITRPLDFGSEITREADHRTTRVGLAGLALALDDGVGIGSPVAHRAAHASPGDFVFTLFHENLLKLAREFPDSAGKPSYGSLKFDI